MNTYNQPAAQDFQVNDVILAQEQQFAAAVSDQLIVWEKECAYAMQAFQNNELLANAAAACPDSLRAAIVNVAAIGISLNPMLKHAYLVPRRLNGVSRVCLDISYQGLLDLAVAEGSILWGQAKLVYENDTYANTGIDTKPIHEYNAFKERGNITGVYCTVKTPDGSYLTEEMDIAEINKIRAASKAANGPWKSWFGEMARKACIKRGSKTWPGASLRLQTAVHMLNEHEGNAQSIKDVPQSQSATVQELLADGGETYQINGMTVEDWVLAASSEEEFNSVRTMIREMPEGKEQDRMKSLWIKMRDDMRGAENEQRSQ